MTTASQPVHSIVESSCRLLDASGDDGTLHRITQMRLWATIFVPNALGHPILVRWVLDSGAPVSVLPFRWWNSLGTRWDRLTRFDHVSGQAIAEEAFGIPCELGRIDVWLAHRGNRADLRGPFSMTAKFLSDPGPQPPSRIPVFPLLGLDFFAEHGSLVRFECPTSLSAEAGFIEIR